MFVLYIIFLTLLSPILYPLYKLYKKEDINIFDVLIIFISVFFIIIPLSQLEVLVRTHFEFSKFAVFYSIFITPIIFINYWWTRERNNFKSILNLTKFIRQFRELKLSKIYYIFLIIIFVYAVTFYIPRATIIVKLENSGVKTYQDSAAMMAFGNFFFLIGILLTFSFNFMIKTKIRDIKVIIFFSIYFILLIFFPRRTFVYFLLQFVLIFYSINRNLINKKFLTIAVVSAIGVYVIYFPFYNMMRNNSVTFNATNPIESLQKVFDEGIENSRNNSDDELKKQEDRSLGLIVALDRIMKNNQSSSYGGITKQAILWSTPSFFVNKKNELTSEKILELKSGTLNDQADSIFLLSYGDFGLFGGIYSVILYVFIFILYHYYAQFFNNSFNLNIVPIFILFSLFSLMWNVEGKLESALSWFFNSVFVIVTVFIFERVKIIALCNKSEKKMTHRKKKG